MAKRTTGLLEENAAGGQSESPTGVVDAFTASPLQDQVNIPRPQYFIRAPSKDGFPSTFAKVNDQSSEFLKKNFYLSIGSVALSQVLHLALVAFW